MESLTIIAKGSSGGGRSGGGSRSSGSNSKSSTSKTTTPKTIPGGKIKTSDGKEIQTSAKKPSNSKYQSSKGIVGDNGYSPKFTGGYTAPAGSVVYYPQHSMLDYLPWIYLFSQDSPQHDEVIVVEPDGKEVAQAPVKEGIDGMVVFNWIMLILIALAVVGGVIWGVYKWQQRKR